MGNRALRKQLASKIKELKLPYRLYTRKKSGKKLYSILNAEYLKKTLMLVSMLPTPGKNNGAVLASCASHNFWNVRVKSYESKAWLSYDPYNNFFSPSRAELVLTNGDGYCACSSLEGAKAGRRSREEMEAAFCETVEMDPDKYEVDSLIWKAYCWVKAGAHITDEDGVLLPQWQGLSSLTINSGYKYR